MFIKELLESITESNSIQIQDAFDLELNQELIVETGVVGFTDDGIIIEADQTTLDLLQENNLLLEEKIKGVDNKACWKGKRYAGRKKKADGSYKDICVPVKNESIQDLEEAEYHGKQVPLGKKLPGDVKKSKVYVRKPNGKIVKVNFGDKKMRIKKSNPKRRKSFRARHHCENPGPRWKARYWSCRAW